MATQGRGGNGSAIPDRIHRKRVLVGKVGVLRVRQTGMGGVQGGAVRVKEWDEWIGSGCKRSLNAQREKGKNKEISLT